MTACYEETNNNLSNKKLRKNRESSKTTKNGAFSVIDRSVCQLIFCHFFSNLSVEILGEKKLFIMNEVKFEKETIKDEPMSVEEFEEVDRREGKSYESDDDAFERVRLKVESDDENSVEAILEKKRAQEQLPFVTVENLRNLVIKLRHTVPPQHKIERAAGSHVPSPAEKEAFQQVVPKNRIKNGVFTPEEDQIIVDNWKAFCKIHNWDERNPKPFLYMRQSTNIFYLKKERERKKFVQFLADGLPRRTLYSVYHRFRILYDSPKLRAKYSPQEDECIINHIEHNQNLDKTRMFADLAEALNRTRASVWRRYRLLKAKRADFADDY